MKRTASNSLVSLAAVFVSSRNSPQACCVTSREKRLCGRQLILTFSHSPAF